MVELFRSIAGFSWGMTLFGSRQLGNLVLADPGRAAAAFDKVAAAARIELGDDFGRISETAQGWQSDAVARLFGFPVPDPVALSIAMLEQSAEGFKILPGQASAGQEMVNKLQAFGNFRFVESRLSLATEDPLETRLDKAAALEPYTWLWATEGLGFAHAELAGHAPRGLLRDRRLPVRAKVQLHTGMGLSLARSAFAKVETRGGDKVIRAALERLLTLCEANAAAGYDKVVFEALGLILRHLHPHLLRRVDYLLAAMDPEFVACFWHGAGRALYFVPSHALPRSAAWRRALEKARDEPPHELGRSNALAGFAWALTLVNIRHPAVLESLLRSEAERIFDRPAFADGVGSALAIWHNANGREAYLEALLAHQPQGPSALWQRLVTRPGEAVLESGPAQGRDQAIAESFRYRGILDVGSTVSEPRARTLPNLERGLDGWLSRALEAFSQ